MLELFVGIVQYFWEKNQQQRYFDSKVRMLNHIVNMMIKIFGTKIF